MDPLYDDSTTTAALWQEYKGMWRANFGISEEVLYDTGTMTDAESVALRRHVEGLLAQRTGAAITVDGTITDAELASLRTSMGAEGESLVQLLASMPHAGMTREQLIADLTGYHRERGTQPARHDPAITVAEEMAEIMEGADEVPETLAEFRANGEERAAGAPTDRAPGAPREVRGYATVRGEDGEELGRIAIHADPSVARSLNMEDARSLLNDTIESNGVLRVTYVPQSDSMFRLEVLDAQTRQPRGEPTAPYRLTVDILGHMSEQRYNVRWGSAETAAMASPTIRAGIEDMLRRGAQPLTPANPVQPTGERPAPPPPPPARPQAPLTSRDDLRTIYTGTLTPEAIAAIDALGNGNGVIDPAEMQALNGLAQRDPAALRSIADMVRTGATGERVAPDAARDREPARAPRTDAPVHTQPRSDTDTQPANPTTGAGAARVTREPIEGGPLAAAGEAPQNGGPDATGALTQRQRLANGSLSAPHMNLILQNIGKLEGKDDVIAAIDALGNNNGRIDVEEVYALQALAATDPERVRSIADMLRASGTRDARDVASDASATAPSASPDAREPGVGEGLIPR